MCRDLFIVLLSSSGMELFEEALHKWEQALNIRHRTHSGNSTANSLVPEGSELVEHHSVNITRKQQLYSGEWHFLTVLLSELKLSSFVGSCLNNHTSDLMTSHLRCVALHLCFCWSLWGVSVTFICHSRSLNLVIISLRWSWSLCSIERITCRRISAAPSHPTACWLTWVTHTHAQGHIICVLL